MPQAAMPAPDILGPAVHLCLPWPAAGYCCWNLLQCLCTQPSHTGTYNNDSSTNRSSVLQLLHTGQINKKLLMMWLSWCSVLQPIASVAGCSSRGWQKGHKLLKSNTGGYAAIPGMLSFLSFLKNQYSQLKASEISKANSKQNWLPDS